MATGILTVGDPSLSPSDLSKHAAKLKSITQAIPEIWVYGNMMDDAGNTAFLSAGKQVLSIKRQRVLLEVDGEQDWFRIVRLDKVVYVVK